MRPSEERKERRKSGLYHLGLANVCWQGEVSTVTLESGLDSWYISR